MAKSWNEKFNNGKDIQIKTLDKKFADINTGEKMLIATPKILDDYIRQIPSGTETSLKTIRNDLAIELNADKTCPVTTGIFLRIVAEKAYEEWQNGTPLNSITPFWRVIDKKAPIVKKLSFGYDFIEKQRKNEGLPA